MPFLQDLLHKLEVGGGMRYLRVGLAVLAVVLLIGGYNLRAFRNMGTQEAMDAAQLARNIAQGKGYTTLFIRPFSMFLVKKHNLESGRAAGRQGRRPGRNPGHASRPGQSAGLSGRAGRADEDPAVQLYHFDHQTVLEQRRQVLALRARFPHCPVQPGSVSGGSSRWSSFWPGACLIPGSPGSRPACCWARNCSGDSACPGCPRCC